MQKLTEGQDKVKRKDDKFLEYVLSVFTFISMIFAEMKPPKGEAVSDTEIWYKLYIFLYNVTDLIQDIVGWVTRHGQQAHVSAEADSTMINGQCLLLDPCRWRTKKKRQEFVPSSPLEKPSKSLKNLIHMDG